jgi:hypothetical protein
LRAGTVTLPALTSWWKKSKGSVVETLPCFLGKLIKSEVRSQNAEVTRRARADKSAEELALDTKYDHGG